MHEDPVGWDGPRLPGEGWTPATPADQSCAFCGGDAEWVHPLHEERVGFRVQGKGHTLPTFWCTCSGCEPLAASGSRTQLAERYLARWAPNTDLEDAERVIDVFLLADLGSRRL